MVKQKKLIKEWFNQNKEKIKELGGGLVNDWWQYEEKGIFPMELYDKIEAINDTEILSQNISHYIQELVSGGD